ncbi:PhzF family phenazine biosynthesis protein [Parvularcula maris]|uniref:PhzF family phenazine biosynthesis protein n=1 Tax=Parvularcula maris TaxID=2965077 RepID=A0A9X2L957_9PROT|nr:PhzF family phenazine biosynthesis protein [Parvularcula maris]MCQ8185408.1 PhzF family phenazine biosynthesis protein [Parvularcula maris]
MNEYPYVVVDAFTDRPFAGNPAAVMVLDAFLPDDLLQNIAIEHNLAETAFLVKRGEAQYDLRWFTPGGEVPLCGHATMASGFALMTEYGVEGDEVAFETKSGTLTVRREGERFVLNLPAQKPEPMENPPSLKAAIDMEAEEVLVFGHICLAVLESEEALRSVVPDQAAISALPVPELGITARGEKTDIVSRLFAPELGIPEDPFTGALHAVAVPYWAEKLGRNTLTAHQASARGGDAECELADGRVILRGQAVLTMRGSLFF